MIGKTSAQSPGDFPSADAIRGIANGKTANGEGLPIGAFMVLDKSGNLVYIPGMTYERYRELESGSDSSGQAFVFEPLEIKGTATDGRAQLDLTLEVTVEPTDGQYVSIPLKMANFFLLRAPEFTSSPAASKNDSQFLQTTDEGMVLKVLSQRRRKLSMRMSVSALVQTGPNRLNFQLPNLPTNIQLETDLAEAVGEVLGSGSEVFQSRKTKTGGTQFDIATGGGSLTLQWTPPQRGSASTELLESESIVLVNWGSPQDQPIATVTLSLRSMRELRGPIESFQLDLPVGSVLLDTPVIEAKDQPVTLSTVAGRPDRVQISIPEQERSQRIAIRFELQLANDDASEIKPLQLIVPRVVGALRQQGEIQIQTSSNYRLRWRSSPWVRSFLTQPATDSNSTRVYQFRFDRGDFALPIWLSANKRQLHVTSESIVGIRESFANLEMEIQFKGRATDSRSLQIDLADWRLLAVIDADTDETLPWFESDQTLSIEMNTSVDELPPVKIFAQRTVKSKTENELITFSLPKVVRGDESLSIGTNTVTFQSTGRSTLVVDLDQSKGIERAPATAGDEQPKVATSRFRVLPGDTAAKIIGSMVQQPPQITLASNANITLLGKELTAVVDWSVNPQVDLVGRLPVRVPLHLNDTTNTETNSADLITIESENDASEDLSSSDTDLSPQPLLESNADVFGGNASDLSDDEIDRAPRPRTRWTVTVDDVAARLVSRGGDRFDLVSDRLGIEPVVIRWQHQEEVETASLNEEIVLVAFPVPAVADVTVRGDVLVTTKGDSVTNLLAADTASKSQIEFQSVPDRVRVRMTKLSKSKNDLAIRKAVLRTAVGTNTRHEQLLALIQGGDTLDVGLPGGLGDIEVEARVDRNIIPFRRDGNRLRLSLPGDSETHRIDLRIWATEPSSGLMATIKPILQLPLRAGRIYWQVITPRDTHIVWSAPTVGREMDWQFADWSLSRQPVYGDATLTQWVGLNGVAPMPPGNRYLYLGSDIRSFSTRTLSRATLWLIVGGLVLAIAWMLSYFPASRSPITAVIGAVLFAGLVALAPDAAVMAGQLTMVALVLVIIMIAIGSLARQPLLTRSGASALQSRSNRSRPPSTQTRQANHDSRAMNETVTAAHSPSEAAS